METDQRNPLEDPARLSALRQTALLDSPPEESFDRLTRLATRLLHAPIAMVSLVDDRRQFFKSAAGLPPELGNVRETPLSHSFCQHVVTTADELVIEDAREHPLVRNNRAVCDLGVVAYAGVPLTTIDGEVLGSFCAIDTKPRVWTTDDLDGLRDLAAAVMTEIGLRTARDAAQAASRAKDRFLAVLSHELRTPVSPALMIAAGMATDASLPAQVREDARTIQRNIAQQTRLIDDLLDVTRIENGKLSMRLSPVDLHGVLEDCHLTCAPEANEKGVRVELVPTAGRHMVSGDSGRLRQVFANLLRNAVKFTPTGGAVTIRTADGEMGICVEIHDTGIGVEPAVLAKMFDPFEQGTRAITNEFSGLGLGLAISKGVTEAHGGSITAASEGPGRGTKMTVELPTINAPVPTPILKPVPATTSEQGKREGLQILVVDDHHDTLRAMSRLLRRLDHRVTTADSKAAALTAAATGDFDLLISDIGLPDGSGLELMRELLETLPGRPLKGIALTGYGTASDVQQTRDAGFATHLTKPINFRDLEEAIEAVRA